MSTFRVALSGDFVKADCMTAFPVLDLSSLSGDNIEYSHLPREQELKAASMEIAHALVQLGVRRSVRH